MTISSRSTMTLYRLCAVVALCAACSNDEAARQRYMENGNLYLADKKYDEAILEYRNVLQLDENFGEARLKLGEAYAGRGNAAAAMKEYVRAADLLPGNTDAQLKATRFLLITGQFEDARTRVQRVLEKEPANVDAQVLLGNALAGLRDLDGAIAEMEEAIQLDPARGESYSGLAFLRLARGEREQAQAAFEKAVAIDPKAINSWLALANFQLSSGDLMAAEASLERALALDRAHVLTNRVLAALYLSTNRSAEAEQPLKTIAEATKEPAAKFALADYYLLNKRTSEGTRLLEELAKERVTAGAAESRLAAADYQAGNTEAAHRRLDGVITREPNNASALMLKSRWLAGEGKVEDALARSMAATKADPQSVPARYLLGTIQAQLRRNEEAIESFNEVIRLNPRAAAAQVQLSRLHLVGGAPDKAVQLAEGALANAPGDPGVRATLARGLLARRDALRAEKEIGALLKDYPNAALPHALDGDLRLLRNDLAGARSAYARAQQLDARSVEATVGLTRIDLLQKQVPQARARVESSLTARPDHPGLLLLAAHVYATGSDLPKAEQTLRRLIEKDPANLPAYALLARIYVSQGKLDAARAEFDQIVKREPKNIAARTMAAMAVDAQRNIPEAKRRYQEILEEAPTAAVAANNLAWIYADEGTNLDVALRLAESALKQLPDTPEVLDTLGWIYYRQELPSLAIQRFQASIQKDPNNAMYHYHLAAAHEKLGEAPQARAAVQRALALQPQYPDAQRLLASLRQ